MAPHAELEASLEKAKQSEAYSKLTSALSSVEEYFVRGVLAWFDADCSKEGMYVCMYVKLASIVHKMIID